MNELHVDLTGEAGGQVCFKGFLLRGRNENVVDLQLGSLSVSMCSANWIHYQTLSREQDPNSLLHYRCQTKKLTLESIILNN